MSVAGPRKTKTNLNVLPTTYTKGQPGALGSSLQQTTILSIIILKLKSHEAKLRERNYIVQPIN